MANVHDGKIANLVARKEVTPSESTEGYGEVGPGDAVDDSSQEIDAGWPIYRRDRDVEIKDPGE
jgi:hypothetical protein